MTIPYLLRLICICLASFSILFAIAGFAVALFIPRALRSAERMSGALAARFTFLLRILPTVFAFTCVAAICLPSYIRFEQRGESEEVGLLCLALASLTGGFFAAALFRATKAWRRTRHAHAVLALKGLLRHTILISEAAKYTLSSEQLEMAVRHERAHAAAGDNLKRLFILLTPGPLPRFGALECAWKRFAEWAADDRAAAGDPQRALCLAEALVRVAKLGTRGETSLLMTSFLASSQDLATRVNRLLNPPAATNAPGRLLRSAALVSAALMAAAMLYPSQVHTLLEQLIH
jgi:hypothetical protein